MSPSTRNPRKSGTVSAGRRSCNHGLRVAAKPRMPGRPVLPGNSGSYPQGDRIMSTIASGLLLIGLFLYVFWPDRNPQAQHNKTRLEYLRERRDVLYDNLRDLNFEFRSGKYP